MNLKLALILILSSLAVIFVAQNIIPVEIKSRMTVSNDFFKGLIDWREITKQEDVESYVVYAGKENLIRKQGNIYTWEDITKMMKKIYKNS